MQRTSPRLSVTLFIDLQPPARPINLANPHLKDKPLQWWQEHHNEYPILSQMAFDLFSIPAMSSECERQFSKAGQLLNNERPRLSAECGEGQLLIKSWIGSGIITPELGQRLLRERAAPGATSGDDGEVSTQPTIPGGEYHEV